MLNMLREEKKGGKMDGGPKVKKEIPEYLSLWQKEVSHDQMHRWCGNPHSAYKEETRNYIMSKKYRSVLDVGAGVCSEYFGFQKSGYQIEYTATEITPKFVEFAVSKGINALVASSENQPFKDNSFDCCICLGVLNHLMDPRPSLLEMLRVTRKEIIVSFFKPFAQNAVPGVDLSGKYKLYTTPTGIIEERSVLHHPYRVIGIYNYINKRMLLSFLESQNVNFTFSIAADNTILLKIEKRENM